MKKAARSHDIPITDFELIESQSEGQLIERFGLPMVVKPLAESGARGVKVLRTLEDVKQHAKKGLLAEAFVDGSEISVETFIQKGKPIFHNITDYLHQWKKSILPAELGSDLSEKILQINDEVIKAFEVQNGMTHAEFYLTKSGPLFGEIAIRPPGGYYMELIEKAYGFNPWETYICLETGGELGALPEKALQQAAVYMIHPGAGVVKSITGLESIEKIEQIFFLKMRVKEGDLVNEHESTSSESGHILLNATSKEVLLKKISEIERTLHIEMK